MSRAVTDSASPEPSVERETMRRVYRRLIPLLGLIIFIAMLDRTNIGVAALTMRADLGLSATLFGLGATAFAVTYCLFEIPSNLLLERVGARIWFARIMVTWGVATMLTALVTGPTGFLANRALLGAAEAGLTPGIIWYVSRWFPRQYRATAMGGCLIAQPIASMIGNPISGLLLARGAFGLEGWQWLFVVEGGLAVVMAAIPLFLLQDRPGDAAWLSAAQRDWLAGALREEHSAREGATRQSWAGILRDPRILLLTFAAVAIAGSIHAIGFWLPTIVRDMASSSDRTAAFLSALPYACACLAILASSAVARRTERPGAVLAVLILCTALGLAILPFVTGGPALAILSVILGLAVASAPLLWTVVTLMLSDRAAAGGIALISTIGNAGTGLGPALIGLVRDATSSFSLGYILLASILGASGAAVAILEHRLGATARRESREPRGGGR